MTEIPQLALAPDGAAINDFNRNLNHDQEVGLMLTSFGQIVTVNITVTGFIGMRLIMFKGFLRNNIVPVKLLVGVFDSGEVDEQQNMFSNKKR